MREKVVLGLMAAVGITAIAGFAIYSTAGGTRVSPTAVFTVPGKPGMTVDMAHELYYQVTPALLLEVFLAHDRGDGARAALAAVSHGAALEALAGPLAGDLAGGGLVAEDQTIHEVKLLSTSVTRDAADLRIDATWQVIGTLDDTAHLHATGNTYSADLTVSPVTGAWRITAFDLREVDASGAGALFDAPE